VRLCLVRLTQEALDVMVAAEQVCQIYDTPFGPDNPANLDHDHKDGRPRSMLCRSCNLGLGNFKDSTAVLLRAYEYLTGTAPSLPVAIGTAGPCFCQGLELR
jgi:Recombination endonuclease VII